MPEKIDLPDGGWAEFRTELNGGDQKWYLIRRDKLMRQNGTGKPARTELDPENPAVMVEHPAVPPELTAEDNITLLDIVAERLLLSWSRPEPLPWRPPSKTDPGTRETLPLEVINAVDAELVRQSTRLLGGTPKPRPNGTTSPGTSPSGAPAPQPE